MSDIPDTPAKRIKRLRIEKEMTQDELARLCGVSRVTILHYEQGHASPNKKVRKLAVALGTTVEYILYGDTTPSKTPVVDYNSGAETEATNDRSWELMEYIFQNEDKRILELLKQGRVNEEGQVVNTQNGTVYSIDDDSRRLVRLAIKNALKEMIAGKREILKMQNTKDGYAAETTSEEGNTEAATQPVQTTT